MGNFYVNIVTNNTTAAELEEALKSRQLNAYVITGSDGCCTVFEEGCDTQNTKHISWLLKELSGEFNCAAIGFLNHDDDLLAYELWRAGKKIDEYDSSPEYFNEEPSGSSAPEGGDAALLAESFGKTPDLERVKQVLESREYVFAVERHQALVSTLGIPNHGVGLGYSYVSQGEYPHGVSLPDIIETKSKP